MSGRSWSRENFTVSTDHSLLDHSAISAALASSQCYWAPDALMDPQQLTLMLNKSLCFGLYEHTDGMKQIGLARWVTDQVTIAYLTDVYVLPQYQGRGLGKWLNTCSDEWLADMHYLRRALLITGVDDGGERFYEKSGKEGGLSMMRLRAAASGIVAMNRWGPGRGRKLIELEARAEAELNE